MQQDLTKAVTFLCLLSSTAHDTHFTDGVVFRQGSYLSAVADIGVFEHSLTTDLLNHLVFVQKVFMKVSDACNCCATDYSRPSNHFATVQWKILIRSFVTITYYQVD